eukprot:gene23630-29869_t
MQTSASPGTVGYVSSFVEIFVWVLTMPAYQALWELFCPIVNPYAWGYDFWYDGYARGRVPGHRMGIMSTVRVLHEQNTTQTGTGRTDNTPFKVKWAAVQAQEAHYKRRLGVDLKYFRTHMDLANTSWNGAVKGYLHASPHSDIIPAKPDAVKQFVTSPNYTEQVAGVLKPAQSALNIDVNDHDIELICDQGVVAGEGMEWHSDGAEGEATVLMAVSDVDEAMGSLRVIPGSHLLYVPGVGHEESVLKSKAKWLAEHQVVYGYRAGQPMMIDARTLHSVSRNSSDKWRLVIWFIYDSY